MIGQVGAADVRGQRDFNNRHGNSNGRDLLSKTYPVFTRVLTARMGKVILNEAQATSPEQIIADRHAAVNVSSLSKKAL